MKGTVLPDCLPEASIEDEKFIMCFLWIVSDVLVQVTEHGEIVWWSGKFHLNEFPLVLFLYSRTLIL